MAPESQLTNVDELILELDGLFRKTERDIVETNNEITRADKRVRAFEQMSHDTRFGQYYVPHLELAQEELLSAEKRKERLGRQREEVSALLERAWELSKRSSAEGSK